MAQPRILSAGESAITVEFGSKAERRFHDQVLALDAALTARPLPGIVETVPTYRSLMISFDPKATTAEDLTTALADYRSSETVSEAGRLWRIPACYDPPHGEDVEEVAELLKLSTERVAELHANARYRVVMYGFAPGFVFIDGLPEELAVSRRTVPRPPAQPGALTIANGQALIASVAMPTGWYVVGRTPARTFDRGGETPFPLAVGDEITFERVSASEFDALAKEAENGATLLREVE